MSGSIQGDDVEYESNEEGRSQSLPLSGSLVSDNSDVIIAKHKLRLSPELQEDHVDVLILHAPGDMHLARKLESCINALTFKVDGIDHQGKAVLLDDAVIYVRGKVDQLDEATKFATVMCAIVTPEFLTTEECRHTGSASFWNTTQNESKKGTFLLAFGPPRASVGKIPAYFNQLKTSVDLLLPDDELKCILHMQIRRFLNERLKRDWQQKQDRIDYLKRWNSIDSFMVFPSEFARTFPRVSTNDISGSQEDNESSMDEGFGSVGMRSMDESFYDNSIGGLNGNSVGGFNGNSVGGFNGNSAGEFNVNSAGEFNGNSAGEFNGNSAAGTHGDSATGFNDNSVEGFNGNSAEGFNGKSAEGFSGNSAGGFNDNSVGGSNGNSAEGSNGNSPGVFNDNSARGFNDNSAAVDGNSTRRSNATDNAEISAAGSIEVERNHEDAKETYVDPACNPWLFLAIGIVIAAVITGVSVRIKRL